MVKRVACWADLHFIPNWRTEWRRLWTMRVALFWLVVGGLVTLAPMVSEWAQGIVGAGMFSALFLAGFVSVGLARILKQPGAEE